MGLVFEHDDTYTGLTEFTTNPTATTTTTTATTITTTTTTTTTKQTLTLTLFDFSVKKETARLNSRSHSAKNTLSSRVKNTSTAYDSENEIILG